MAETPLGLRTVIYRVSDLEKAKSWYASVFGLSPYFDEPFYVGFNIGGFELGLDPDISETGPGPGGCIAYWGVANLNAALANLAADGTPALSPARDVGEGIRVASVADPFGNVIGLIENPHYNGGA